jgi:chromosome segregation ATPase
LVGQHAAILDQLRTWERSDTEERKREWEMLQALRADAMNAFERADQRRQEQERLQSKLSELEGRLESAKGERAGAEERWNAADDQRHSLIRTLHKTVEELELRLKGAGQERDELAASLHKERESLELAWKEATDQREALAATRAEFKERVDVLERQQEEFLAHLVDEYDAQLAAAREEVEALRAKRADADSLLQAQQERDSALRELDVARAAQQRVASLEAELESLREGAQEKLHGEVKQLREDLKQARAGVDQLLCDCDRLSAENVRLREQVESRESPAVVQPLAFDLDESPDDGNDALALAQARSSRSTAPRHSARKSSGKKAAVSTADGRGKSARPPGALPPAVRSGPEERTVGSYSLIGGEFAEEAVGGKPKGKTG